VAVPSANLLVRDSPDVAKQYQRRGAGDVLISARRFGLTALETDSTLQYGQLLADTSREGGTVTTQERSIIVVGVDGSEASKDALAWASGQAHLSSAELLAITAWRPPTTYGYPVGYSDVDFESEARKKLEQIVDEVLGSEPSVPVVTRVAKGHPAQVLIDAAEGASLLVVGSRGLGAFTGMLLGSTSQHCVQHAPTPVVVIRHPQVGQA
jgi:nucleotide-binding universal stress UspA family protein